MTHSVLLDTSFLIRLLNDEDPLHKNAREYFKYFIQKDIILKVSTISIAEYCVRGKIEDLPLRNLQIVPFNLDHARKTGEFAAILFQQRRVLENTERVCIPNDSKLFAQADIDKTITHFISSDSSALVKINTLKNSTKILFDFMDIHIPYNETFGLLDL